MMWWRQPVMCCYSTVEAVRFFASTCATSWQRHYADGTTLTVTCS